jgi:hypothetical protein
MKTYERSKPEGPIISNAFHGFPHVAMLESINAFYKCELLNISITIDSKINLAVLRGQRRSWAHNTDLELLTILALDVGQRGRGIRLGFTTILNLVLRCGLSV